MLEKYRTIPCFHLQDEVWVKFNKGVRKKGADSMYWIVRVVRGRKPYNSLLLNVFDTYNIQYMESAGFFRTPSPQ